MNNEASPSSGSLNAFDVGHEVADNYFAKAAELAPAVTEGLLALHREYLRAWADGVGAWLNFGNELMGSLNANPTVSAGSRTIARDFSETWIKAGQEAVTGTLAVWQNLVRGTAAGTLAVHSAGFKMAHAAVAATRAPKGDATSAKDAVVEAATAAKEAAVTAAEGAADTATAVKDAVAK